ncbi:magnesium transporter MgtE [Abditibacteriota bacterium]|nr:magnesium transporter MgtE [Abditibacteriota bacterium]
MDQQIELLTSLRAALKRPASETGEMGLMAVLRGVRPEDIAEAAIELSNPEVLAIFNGLDNEHAAELLGLLEDEATGYILENAPAIRITDMLDRLPMDDAADVLDEASPEKAEELLTSLQKTAPDDAEEIRDLLSYPEHSAGRLMTDAFMRLRPDMSVNEAFAAVRDSDEEVETLSDLFVVETLSDGRDMLTGVISLRELVRAGARRKDPNVKIRDFMTTDVISVSVDTDQQECARLIAKYDFTTLPVLDRNHELVGIVTFDDIIDVLVEEFDEDLMRFVGSDADVMDKRTPVQIARLRLPWLMGTMVLELIAGLFISRFDYVLTQVVLLASFMPVISALSGNVGLQAAAIVVRGLDTGHVSLETWGRSLGREVASALIMALVSGTVLGSIGWLWSHHVLFGVVVGIALTCSMLTASVMGTLIPMLSRRLGFDPATTAGPFETAFQDVIGYTVFLWLASLMLPLLK